MGIGTEQGDRNGTFRVHGLEDVKIIKVHCDNGVITQITQ